MCLPYNLALVFAGLQQTEEALDWLSRAFEDRDVHILFLLDHKWDRLRFDSRFAAFTKPWKADSANVTSSGY